MYRRPEEHDYLTGFGTPVWGEIEPTGQRPAARGAHAAPVVLRPARRLAWTLVTVLMVLLALALFLLVADGPRTVVTQLTPPSAGIPVCGQPILDSPYSYDGPSGTYTSGKVGLPTFGSAGTDFPAAVAGVVLPPGTASYLWNKLAPDTVYYFEPGGTYKGQIQADSGDVFVGGYTASLGGAVMNGEYDTAWGQAIDPTPGVNTPGVTIEYLTIQHYTPAVNNAAVNDGASTGWTVKYDTITHNVPGTGLLAETGSITKDDCITQNGQFGFQSGPGNLHELDTLTGGPYGITVEGDEISYNDVCDLEGTINNTNAGYHDRNPVPDSLRNPHCTVYGAVPTNAGEQGGFKLFKTNGVLIKDNWIHNNFGPGGWADTNNANTTWTGNYISNNDDSGIDEEISYNFSIYDNTLIGNDVVGGLGNPDFPAPAIYVYQSGSDSLFGGVPACSEPGCSGFPAYTFQSSISDNKFINNGGGVFLWADPTRYCHTGGGDNACTLVDPSVFTQSSCASNFSTASVNAITLAGNTTGSPAEDWWDGCQWENENIVITGNRIVDIPSQILDCTSAAWPTCGENGVTSYFPTSSPSEAPTWAVATAVTFYRSNVWSDNTYIGPPKFRVWTAANKTVTPAQWTGPVSADHKCSSSEQQASEVCTGPFGQDAGALFQSPLRGMSALDGRPACKLRCHRPYADGAARTGEADTGCGYACREPPAPDIMEIPVSSCRGQVSVRSDPVVDPHQEGERSWQSNARKRSTK